RALGQRGVAHLHRRGLARLIADHADVEPELTQLRERRGVRARGIEPGRRRAGPGRRPDDTGIDEAGAAPSTISAIRRVVWGAIALQSTYSGRAPLKLIARPTRSASATASAGTRIERKMSDLRTRASSSVTSSIPALSASARVRSLRPSRRLITRRPPRRSTAATAWPMSPGDMIAMVGFIDRAPDRLAAAYRLCPARRQARRRPLL